MQIDIPGPPESAMPTFQEMVEYDVVVRMPPKSRCTITLKLKLEEGKPRVIEPDWIEVNECKLR